MKSIKSFTVSKYISGLKVNFTYFSMFYIIIKITCFLNTRFRLSKFSYMRLTVSLQRTNGLENVDLELRWEIEEDGFEAARSDQHQSQVKREDQVDHKSKVDEKTMMRSTKEQLMPLIVITFYFQFYLIMKFYFIIAQ